MPSARAALRSEPPVPWRRALLLVAQEPGTRQEPGSSEAGDPDPKPGNKKPADNQLCVRICETASTGLASLEDFVSFAVVLILS